MKYGESFFDILYLFFAIISGCVILHRAKSKTERLMVLPRCFWAAGTPFTSCPAC